jgi:hypothetical protein
MSVLFCARRDRDLTFAENSGEAWFNVVYNWNDGNFQTGVNAYLGFNHKVFDTNKIERCAAVVRFAWV